MTLSGVRAKILSWVIYLGKLPCRAGRGIDTMLYREEYECMYVVDVIHQDLG